MNGVRLLCAVLGVMLCAVQAHAAEAGGVKENPFGVLEFLHWNHEWNNYQYSSDEQLLKAARMMKEAGVGMVRMDFLWQDIEARRGEFDFAKYDRIVGILTAEGIGILGILEYSADWDSPSGEWNAPSADHSAYLAYVRKVVERYRDRVRHWEVWNEPDSPVYWKNQDGLVAYCGLLAETYRLLKQLDPQCMVLNGGLTHELSAVNRLYDNGGKGYFDALNIHIFANPMVSRGSGGIAAYVRSCAKIMARNGDGRKKIWVTETGCPGVSAAKRVKNWWLGENPGEKEQADWLSRLFDVLLAQPQVEKVFWAFFRDTNDHWKDGTDHLGLVRNDFSRKPAFEAYERAYRAWRGRGKK